MAPNPRGIPTPRSKKVRRYNELTIIPKRNPLLRPAESILTPPSNLPPFKRGVPLFNNDFELFRQQVIKAQTRKLVHPEIPTHPLQSLPLSGYFKLNSNVCFELTGNLGENGDTFLQHFINTSKSLHLVGWIKSRRSFALGQLQGDYKSLAYMKRWLELGIIKGTDIKNVTFSQANYGMSTLDFLQLSVIRDYRSESQKGRHEVERRKRAQVEQLKKDSKSRLEQFDQFYNYNKSEQY